MLSHGSVANPAWVFRGRDALGKASNETALPVPPDSPEMTELTATAPATHAASRFAVVLRLVAIAVALAALGLGLRYLAYALTIKDANLGSFAQALCRWDCPWYVKLSETGYDPFPVPTMINAGNWAFFPLYPMLVGGLRLLTGLPTMWIATTTSILLCIGASLLAFPLLDRSYRAYSLFAALLLASPFSQYFTTFYTEVLFLFLTVAVFAALRVQKFLLAGLLAALLSATRIVGVFIVFAILVEVWRAHRAAGGSWRDFVPAVLKRPDLVLAFAVAPVGLFAYMSFLYVQIGDPLAFNHVQRAWGRPFGLPPVFIWYGLIAAPKSGFVPTPSQVLAAATLVGYALTLLLLWRRRFAMGLYSLLCLTLPLFAGLASIMRFVVGLAPMGLAFADLFGRRWWLTGLMLIAMAIGCYYASVGWLTGYVALV